MQQRHPHIRTGGKISKPETLRDDMADIAGILDNSYMDRQSKLEIEVLSLEECRQYNADLKNILQNESPPVDENTENLEHLTWLWDQTHDMRYDWVNKVILDSEERGLASAAKTEFNKLGAPLIDVNPLDYTGFGHLIERAYGHPKGEAVIAFLRWVHEIFYYSRAQPLKAATTYASVGGHFNLPALYVARNIGQKSPDRSSFQHPIYLPTNEALKEMSSTRFFKLRTSQSSEEFMEALTNWHKSGSDADCRALRRAIDNYASDIRLAARNRDIPIISLIVTINTTPLKVFSAAITGIAAATTLMPPLSGVANDLATGSTEVKAGLAGLAGLLTAISFIPEAYYGTKIAKVPLTLSGGKAINSPLQRGERRPKAGAISC